MRIHSQNLNEKVGSEPAGSMLWHGRAWLRNGKRYDELGHIEWSFGSKARDFSAKVTFGPGEDERGIMFHLCLPFLFSIYMTLELGWIRARERRLGFAIHNDAFWLYIFDEAMGSISHPDKRKWYQRYYHWDFPWQYDWYSSEVLTNRMALLAESIYIENRGDRQKLGIDSFEQMRQKEQAEKTVQETWDYRYVLKNGKVQNVKATICLHRMTWRMRWWPLLPFKKVSTSIDVKFDQEVGEGTGSYKGGTVGCGYEIKPNETPLECLRRMESERKFGR